MLYRRAGTAIIQLWYTSNVLDTKPELNDTIGKGLKAELFGNFLPASKVLWTQHQLDLASLIPIYMSLPFH